MNNILRPLTDVEKAERILRGKCSSCFVRSDIQPGLCICSTCYLTELEARFINYCFDDQKENDDEL